MSKPTGIHNGTLSWVKKELDETLKQAAEALEAYSQDARDTAQLQFCATHLHQVHGILQMLELFGASMLVEEMEQVADALMNGRMANREASCEVLMRAILQLSDYLERIQGGLQDIPILVLPLLNDLRAARGANLLTENALFSPDLDVQRSAPRHARLGQPALADAARKLRHRYQLGLLGWLREQNVEKSLAQMLEVLDELDAKSSDDQAGTLWWVASGVVEALAHNALARSVAVNGLLGEVDRQMRRVIQQGEEAFVIAPPRDLIKNLLYYVARAEPRGQRVPAIQAHYKLKELVLDEAQLARAREGLSGPNAEVLQTVAEAIKEDLAGAKDAIDLFVRGGSQDAERLRGVSDVLKRIGDTLGVLGLGMPRTALKEQAALIDAVMERQESLLEPQLLKLAETLLYVESALDGLSARPIANQGGWALGDAPAAPEDRERAERELFELEYQQVFDTVINEAIADVGRIKEAIVKFIETSDDADLATLGSRFSAVFGALRVLEMQRAAQLLEAAGRYVSEHIGPGRAIPPADELDALADAITSIEYYLEAARERRPHPETILDVAASGLERLGYQPRPLEPEQQPAAVEQPAAEQKPTLELLPLDRPEEAAEPVVAPEQASETTESEPQSSVAEPAPAPEPAVAAAPAAPAKKTGRINYDLPLVAEELDPEILEIFVEEAGEVLETLRSEFACWRGNREDMATLTTCRRMFHTLKGSGRLAGALTLGELAWSQENMLNRVLDQTIQPDDEVCETVAQAIALLPALIENIQGGPAPDLAPIHAVMRRAEQLADPNLRRQALESDAEAVEAHPEPVQDAISEQDTVETAPAPVELAAVEPSQIAEEVVEPAEAIEFEPVVLEQPEEVAEPETQELEPLEFEAVELRPLETAAPSAELDLRALDAAELDAVEAVTVEAVELGELEEAGEIQVEEIEAAPVAEVEFEPTSEPALEISVEPAAEPAPEPEPVGMDPVLYDIFSRESADHLAVVDNFIAEGRAHGQRCAVVESVIRALHTLAGSARMAGVDAIAEVARKLELYAEEHLIEDRPFEADDLDVLAQGAELIRAMVAALAEPASRLPDASAVLAALDALRERKPAPATPAPRSILPIWAGEDEPEADEESAPEVSPRLSSVPAEPTLKADNDLASLFLEEAEDILQFLEGTIQRWEDEPDHDAAIAELHRSLHTLKGGARLAGFHAIGDLCHALEGLSGDVAEHRVAADDEFFGALREALDQLSDMLAAAKAGGMPEGSEELNRRIAVLRGTQPRIEPPQAEGAPDTELMAVFLEEAAEILESTESIVHAWQEDPANQDLVNELQRALHTLKGGARMAGFAPIANLAHALETLLQKRSAEGEQPGPALFELLEQVHDRLFAMRAAAAAGQRLTEAEDLLRAIEVQRSDDQAAAAGEAPAAPAKRSAAEAAEVRDDVRGAQGAVRVRADLLDNLVNYAGEVSIYRARLDQQMGAIRFNLAELDQTVARLREQLRTMEIETEAQILYRFERERELEGADRHQDFDPLELDRFSRMQELSRALSESVNDLLSIQGTLENLAREAETLLLQQSRVNTELQDGLMRTRMVPFANLVPRMRRIVRQTCQELGKQAQFKVLGAQGEMDRTVLERVIPPLEHMLRNAVAHGIEAPEARVAAGKPAEGAITVSLAREGADVVIRVSDDGGGINVAAIRRKAIEKGLMPENAQLSDRDVIQFIMGAGFTTAESVTQIAGRGVGLDVVATEIKQLGGTIEIDTVAGRGTTFTVRLPFTLAINQALLCQVGEEVYAIPLTSIEGVVRMSHEELEECFQHPHRAYYDYAGTRYEVRSLARLLGTGEPNLPGPGKRAPVVLMQTGDHHLAIQVDGMLGNREIVVKSVGPQISSVPGVYGATILADGRVVLILDLSTLVRMGAASQVAAEAASAQSASAAPVVMVVDDSITMRKVATRLLERNGYQAVAAKDGVDAVARLQEVVPDAMLLDIEMPRMDGYELATHMRNDPRLRNVPIIMITSRTGEKHRQRAMEIGVDRYLGKPYQEADLLQNLREVLEARRGQA